MVTAGNRLGAVRCLPARLRADMFRAAYRMQRRFVRFCAQAHRNRSRLPASVRRCECAEMHIIPIADQLAESIPIQYQYTKHVNDMRSAPAHHARPPRRCPVSQRATLRDCSHVKQSQVRHSLTLFLSGIALTHGSQGRSHGESGQVRANKTRGKPQSGPQSGLESVARPPTGVARRGGRMILTP
jgi:hypothetical protein